MRERELRLALVFFGGISLAVYMHGISKEILKLVRASRALHAITDRAARASASFFEHADRNDHEYDTEAVYFDLLREIGRRVELRVIVDIIAGASAGGINGVMLARALAHDLPMGKLRDLWLAEADVSELLAPKSKAKAWSKWFLKPMIWALLKTRLVERVDEAEVRSKLSLFVRSRWFRAPFSGTRMAALMLDAIHSMGEPTDPTASLLPMGQQLELFVTLTDFFGYQQLIQIHDPPLIREREHRHILRFGYRRWPSGEIESDFELPDAPGLVFAARATSAFPGAFPPAQIAEVDRLLAARGLAWPGRARFIARNFERYHQSGTDPYATSFIDGSVLNNKPFNQAIQSIKGRPAFRQVDRRLVYIDPDPARPPPPASGRVPGFFPTLKGALSDIPRNEPIADELSWVIGFNERVRRLCGIVDAARPQIARLVADVAQVPPERAFTEEQVRGWREAINMRVAEDAGFAYEGYVRLKLISARAYIAHLLVAMCGIPARSLSARMLAEVVDAWARLRGVVFTEGSTAALRRETTGGAALPRWVQFLLSFDVDYRKRRLGFLIQGQNRIYQMLDEAGAAGPTAVRVDRLKRDFYHLLDHLRRCERADFFSTAACAAARELFSAPVAAEEARRIEAYARSFAERHAAAIDALVAKLAVEINLDAATQDLDALLAAMDHRNWEPMVRREVLVNYLGFPFWDVLTFSVTNWRDASEFNEIRIDRISPEDAHMLQPPSATAPLKGIALGHFGAFFSRAYRENDYLWGRLHAVDRLIDIVCDAAGLDALVEGVDALAFKRRAFEIVLDAEASHLPHSAALIAELRGELARLGSGAPGLNASATS